MHVMLIQPPVHTIQPADLPPGEPPAPPWDLVGLHSYLLSRTGHQSIFFDARLYKNWVEAIDQQLPYDTHQLVVVVRARAFEWPATLQVLRTIRERAPQAMRVLCGPLATACPEICVQHQEVDAALVGDPELTLRALLENRYATGRLRQLPGLALRGRTAQPVWMPDLSPLPPPAWENLPWKSYLAHARGGLRTLMRLSRGHPGQPADRATGGANEPLRIAPLERLTASFGRGAHLGVVETLVVDPPGLWTTDQLRAWCRALQEVHNTHPWSLQLLPRVLSPGEGDDLREAGCRRVELILPSSRPGELARFGVRGDGPALRTAVQSVVDSGLEVLMRVWLGGPSEGPKEREQWLRLLQNLRFPPVRFQPFPFALDAPMVREVTPPPGTPTLNAWLSQVDQAQAPAMAWGGAEGHRRAQALGADLAQTVRESWTARWQRFWTRWRDTSVIEHLEERASGLLRTPEAAEDQLRTGSPR